MKQDASPTYDALSSRDRRLVDAYLRNGMVQRWAYFDVVYSGDKDSPDWGTIDQLASRKFRDAKVRAAISERLEQEAMPAAEALYRLGEQARSPQMRYLQADGSVDLQQLIEDGYSHLVKGTKRDASGNLHVVFHDAQAALKLIGQAHGVFGPTGSEDDPIHHEHKHDLGWAAGPEDADDA